MKDQLRRMQKAKHVELLDGLSIGPEMLDQ